MLRIAIELPKDAAERLVTLLKSQTPEGEEARKALGVISCELAPKGEHLVKISPHSNAI